MSNQSSYNFIIPMEFLWASFFDPLFMFRVTINLMSKKGFLSQFMMEMAINGKFEKRCDENFIFFLFSYDTN